MKIIVFIYVLLIYFSISISSANDSKINFIKESYENVVKKAKTSNKLIFICFTPDSSTAGNCYMDIELQLSTYNEFVYLCNAHFVSTIVNPNSIDGEKLIKLFNIKNYPSFIFTDTNNNIIHKYSKSYSNKILVTEANKALTNINSLAHLSELYTNGVRSPDFLHSYLYTLHNAEVFDSLILFEYLQTQSTKDLVNSDILKVIYDFSIYEFKPIIKANSIYFRLLHDSSELFSRFFGKENVESKIVWILDDAVNVATMSKDEKYFKEIIILLKKYDVGKRYELKNATGAVNGWLTYTNLVSWNTLVFYTNYNDSSKYQDAFIQYTKDIWDNHSLLNDLAWSYYESINNTTMLNNAIKCIKRAIDLKKDANYIDTYAALLYKIENYKEAIIQAKLALQIAQDSKINTEPFRKSIEMIAQKLNNNKN
jgi:hypothetical protein